MENQQTVTDAGQRLNYYWNYIVITRELVTHSCQPVVTEYVVVCDTQKLQF